MDLFLQSYLGQSCLEHLPERKSDAKALPPSLKMIQTALQRVGRGRNREARFAQIKREKIHHVTFILDDQDCVPRCRFHGNSLYRRNCFGSPVKFLPLIALVQRLAFEILEGELILIHGFLLKENRTSMAGLNCQCSGALSRTLRATKIRIADDGPWSRLWSKAPCEALLLLDRLCIEEKIMHPTGG
jgi:hypothetical protein